MASVRRSVEVVNLGDAGQVVGVSVTGRDACDGAPREPPSAKNRLLRRFYNAASDGTTILLEPFQSGTFSEPSVRWQLTPPARNEIRLPRCKITRTQSDKYLHPEMSRRRAADCGTNAICPKVRRRSPNAAEPRVRRRAQNTSPSPRKSVAASRTTPRSRSLHRDPLPITFRRRRESESRLPTRKMSAILTAIMSAQTDRFHCQGMPPPPRRENRLHAAHLGCGLLAALVVALTSAPASACRTSSFYGAAQTAPLVVRANVKSITELPGGRKQVELRESRTLVGIELGRSLTLSLDEPEAEAFHEGSQYLIVLSDPHTLYQDRTGSACGTTSSQQVVDGKIPRFNPESRDIYTLAAAEKDIRARRCQIPGHCPHLCSEPKRSGPWTRSQIFFYLGVLAVGGYAALLLQRRSSQPAGAGPLPAEGPIQSMIGKILNLLSPPLHR